MNGSEPDWLVYGTRRQTPKETPHFIGVDPDMHQLSFILIDQHGKYVDLKGVAVDKKLTGRDALRMMSAMINNSLVHYWAEEGINVQGFTCEAQEIYQHGSGKTKNPRSIMLLATVAGMTLHHLRCLFPRANMYFPAPVEWKGSVPKQIHHGRICSRQGWKYKQVGTRDDGYCVPEIIGDVRLSQTPKTSWKHTLDSIGLAEYGRDQWEYEQKRKLREKAGQV